MADSKKPLVIRVSFKDEEEQLYKDIMNCCNIVGQSAWMKVAAHEKLERDKNQNNKSVESNSTFSLPSTRYESFDQLMQ
jgi:hypothetical protein